MDNEKQLDLLMINAQKHFKKSGLSLETLGLKMGYPKDSARKSAWQFLYKTTDPRLSMICRFAKAMGISAKSLM